MKYLATTALCLLLWACGSFGSDVHYSELEEYKAQMSIEGNNLIVKLDNPAGRLVEELVYTQRLGKTYISARRAETGGGQVSYTVRLSDDTLPPDIKERIIWVNPDGSHSPVFPKYLR